MRPFVFAFVLLAAACGPDLKYCPGCDTPPEETPDFASPPRKPPTSYVPVDMAAPKPCPDLAMPPRDLAEPTPDLSQPPRDMAEPPCQRPSCDQTHCGHHGHHCNHGSSCPFHKEY